MSDEALFVLLGAGASFDAIPDATTADRPPLTRELFTHQRAGRIAAYPLASNVAPEIRDAITREDPAESLEDYLRRRFAGSTSEYNRRRLISIELYLQDLLLSFTDQADHADNYRRLINPLVDTFAHTCFITLNYDILLDSCLRPLERLDTIDDFIAHDRWSLIKPHGSVTWTKDIPITTGGREVGTSTQGVFDSPPPDLNELLDDAIRHRWSTNIAALRQAHPDHVMNVLGSYPVISVPLGPSDKLSCPSEHLNFLKEKVEEENGFDLLVIGYSGLDDSVLDLLADRDAKPRSIYVVDANYEGARQAATRLAEAFGDRLGEIRRHRPDTGNEVIDVRGQGPILWHADRRSFNGWVRGKGHADYRDFLRYAEQSATWS